jgi:hypothetical protein
VAYKKQRHPFCSLKTSGNSFDFVHRIVCFLNSDKSKKSETVSAKALPVSDPVKLFVRN